MPSSTEEKLKLRVKDNSGKRFLVFSDPNQSICDLQKQIAIQLTKIYPKERYPNILRLQDPDQCDLDPDYKVGDVFNDTDLVHIHRKLNPKEHDVHVTNDTSFIRPTRLNCPTRECNQGNEGNEGKLPGKRRKRYRKRNRLNRLEDNVDGDENGTTQCASKADLTKANSSCESNNLEPLTELPVDDRGSEDSSEINSRKKQKIETNFLTYDSAEIPDQNDKNQEHYSERVHNSISPDIGVSNKYDKQKSSKSPSPLIVNSDTIGESGVAKITTHDGVVINGSGASDEGSKASSAKAPDPLNTDLEITKTDRSSSALSSRKSFREIVQAIRLEAERGAATTYRVSNKENDGTDRNSPFMSGQKNSQDDEDEDSQDEEDGLESDTSANENIDSFFSLLSRIE